MSFTYGIGVLEEACPPLNDICACGVDNSFFCRMVLRNFHPTLRPKGRKKKELTATKAEDHKDEANNSVEDSQDGCACCRLHEAEELVKNLHSGYLLREFSCPRWSVEF